jgi:homoserine kinase
VVFFRCFDHRHLQKVTRQPLTNVVRSPSLIGAGHYVDRMRARAPASAANLGPGFDSLALALALHVEVEVTPAPRLEIRVEGEGDDLPVDGSHLAARVATAAAGTDKLAIAVRSSIPVERGL